MMEEEQKRRKEAGRLGALEEVDNGDPLFAAKKELRNTIFVTQAKLNTEGKDFKGRARVLLEDMLASARTALETSEDQTELLHATKDLETRASALDEFLESQW